MLYKLGDKSPRLLGHGHFIAPNSSVVGDVEIGDGASIWFGATIRADNTLIAIGKGSNVQDGAVLHSDDGFPLTVGEAVTIGHNATVHGCTIEARSLIGIGATILNGAVVGEGSVIGANALVPEGMSIPPYSLVIGVPAKVVKTFDQAMGTLLEAGADHYVNNATRYLTSLEEVEHAN